MKKYKSLKKGLTTSLAVGMSVMMGAVPVCAAATGGNDQVYKEESVYVNADATGNVDRITVSNWLKNAGSQSGNLQDQSDLSDIKNVKGEEAFKADGTKITWDTDGEDIYYQGTTSKSLPISVKFTYFLDEKEVKPEEIKGKSGHLKIKISYTNQEKKTVTVDGKEEEVYTPFVMMTGMLLDNENFQNVIIDNGKVISDGNRNIVLGFGMPGLKESLNLSQEMEEDLTIPESLEIEADVTDFKMSSTFTVALTDLLDDLNLDDVVDMDSLQDSLDELEDAALELVSGSDALAKGAEELSSGVEDYTKGADTLNAGIQKYLGSKGELKADVTEYVNGVNKVILGVKDYAAGVDDLADGVEKYVGGEKKLAKGAEELSALSTGLTQVQQAVSALNKALDGKDENDIKLASSQLAAGTKQLKDTLGTTEMKALLSQVDSMVETGNELIAETDSLSSSLQDGIATPVGNIVTALATLQKELSSINSELGTLQKECQKAVDAANGKINDYNDKVDTAKSTADNTKKTIDASISNLKTQLGKTEDEETKKQIQAAIDALNSAKNAADELSSVKKADAISVTIPTVDTTKITSSVETIKNNMEAFEKAAAALQNPFQKCRRN